MWTFYNNTHTAYHNFLLWTTVSILIRKKKTECLTVCRSQKRQYNGIINTIFFVYLASANLTLSRQATYP